MMAFLSAGVTPDPARAQLSTDLAAARRTVAACRRRLESCEAWLAGQVKYGGLRENAAVLATIEANPHSDAMVAYLRRYPDRYVLASALMRLL